MSTTVKVRRTNQGIILNKYDNSLLLCMEILSRLDDSINIRVLINEDIVKIIFLDDDIHLDYVVDYINSNL